MISVLLPVVKLGHCEEALRSILAQTHGDFELVVVDNAADGDVPELLAAHPDPRVRYVRHEPRLPAVANWNRCLEYAAGEWFVLASDDDRYEPGFLAAMHDLAERYPESHLLHSRVKVIDDQGRALRYAPACPEWESGLDFIWHRLHFLREQFLSDFVYRTATLRRLGGFVDFPGGWFTDEATSFALALEGGVACGPAPDFCYRESAVNLTSVAGLEAKLAATAAYADWMRRFMESPAAVGGDPVLLADIRREWPARVRHLQNREILLASGRSPWRACTLLARHGRRYGLSYRELGLAGLAAVVRRRRNRG